MKPRLYLLALLAAVPLLILSCCAAQNETSGGLAAEPPADLSTDESRQMTEPQADSSAEDKKSGCQVTYEPQPGSPEAAVIAWYRAADAVYTGTDPDDIDFASFLDPDCIQSVNKEIMLRVFYFKFAYSVAQGKTTQAYYERIPTYTLHVWNSWCNGEEAELEVMLVYEEPQEARPSYIAHCPNTYHLRNVDGRWLLGEHSYYYGSTAPFEVFFDQPLDLEESIELAKWQVDG